MAGQKRIGPVLEHRGKDTTDGRRHALLAAMVRWAVPALLAGLLAGAGDAGEPPPGPDDPDVAGVFQYFAAAEAPGAPPTAGGYLWIPPAAGAIRGVMVGIHNGLPAPLFGHPDIRRVCRRHGIAQVLLTPNDCEIGTMLAHLRFDLADSARTAMFDRFLQRLAAISEHPELVTAPIVPLAHSAYMSFPFEAAARRPDRCLGAIGIKAGMPDLYAMYPPAADGRPAFDLRGVPILVCDSAAQETVPGRWKGRPYPQVFEPNFLGAYRRDRADQAGTDYEPRNEMIGASWEMMSGHFDMLPREYAFVANWLDAVASLRLPDTAGAALRPLCLRDGWLMDPRVPPAGEIGPSYPAPASYAAFGGDRSRAVWFPRESLARGLFERMRDEMRREVELFTVLDPAGVPVDLSEGPMAVMPDAALLLRGDGVFTLQTHHYTEPPRICTVTDRGHAAGPAHDHVLGNPLFPGRTALVPSDIPLRFDSSGAAIDLLGVERVVDARGVPESRFTLRLSRHRLAPGRGHQMLFPRIYHEGDERYAAAGRTVQIAWAPGDTGREQTLDFPPIADAFADAPRVPLAATSSAGLPVDYFVVQGPGVIRDGGFVPCEVPAGRTAPVAVTIGAYQRGVYAGAEGWRSTPTVYRTFQLVPRATTPSPPR